ncbi:DUF1456 family protein [Alkalimarinus coralli]|uniref:DUF1456 family protein n=1 Tax=Alkalimarinus coralli TaxID=2935863 RepID=UPI00202B5B4D|nr:DUF1456 family protein [Alkalimarinus coralli]
MTNNDILRRLRFTLDVNEPQMVAIFALADHKVSGTQVTRWLKKDDDPAFCPLTDKELAIFLNGLITEKRGQKDGPKPVPENRLNNNIIFRKLKIALNLQSDDVLAIMDLANLKMSKHELSAFFRKPGHQHYRDCHDQIFRNFLMGLQLKYRPESGSK